MAETVTMDKVYKQLKLIERNMVTKQEMERMLESVEIMSNEDTMEQIKQSEEDIKSGRIKEIKSVSDI
jgi:serine/threonine protein kinase HipA of HipAB toxin-antitoxin module